MITRIFKTLTAGAIALAATLNITSCDDVNVSTRQLCPSYVVCYVELNSIVLWEVQNTTNCILIHHGNDPVVYYALTSTGKEKEMYDSLCRKHNDMNYNKYRSFMKNIPYDSVTYNDCDFTSIEISSDTDFDEAHPAGTNLSDVVRFMSYSPYPFIMSGYKSYFYYDSAAQSESFNNYMPFYIGGEAFRSETAATCYPIDKMVKDLVPEDLILVGHDGPGLIGMLCFEQLPSSAGEHTITVKIYTDNDKVLSNTIKMTFSQ